MGQLVVHWLDEPHEATVRRLRDLLSPTVELTVGAEPPAPAEFEILVAGVPRAEHLDASPSLRALLIPWAGLARSTRTLLLERPRVAVHNLHYNADFVAEFAIALLLAAAKHVIPMDRRLRMNDWKPRYGPSPATALAGKRALVLGYGAIGRRTAALCRGIGMTVAAIRRSPETPEVGRVRAGPDAAGDRVHGVERLHELLPGTDVLIITLPLTPETEGLIGERELVLLPETAILVNVARGPIVAEEPLYEALRNRRIRAAGLDVWYVYPRADGERGATSPSRYPFHELDNVVLTPHVAGTVGQAETDAKLVEALAASLNAAARGEEMPFRVDVRRGY